MRSDQKIARVFVDEVLDSAERAQIAVPALLGDLKLQHLPLDQFTPSQFAKLWLELSSRMGDEFFGMGARPMAPGSVTLMGHAIRSADSFEIALRRALRFLNVVIAEPYGRLVVRDSLCRIELAETQGQRSAFAYRTYFLILHGMNCWLVRENIELTRVCFPCAEPKTEGSDYSDFFGIPVEFNRPRASISFDRKYLTRRVRRSEKDLKDFLRTTPENFVRGFRRPEGLKAQIINSCLNTVPDNWPDADGIAYRLGMSRSTLHRRLTQEGLSLRDILSDRRRAIATDLLKNSDHSIAEIGRAAGYTEPSAFYRAFRVWYKASPDEMRQNWRQSSRS